MPSIGQLGKPQSRRYRPDEKAAAVRMVMTLRVELGTKYATGKRVA
jgi:transposase